MKRAHTNSDTISQDTSCAAKKTRLSLFPLWYLPDVVLVEVARNLDFKSLCQLMLVSWRFFELVLGNRRLWSRFKLHIKPCCHFTWPSAYRRFESVIFNDFNDEFCVAFSLDVKQICLMGCTSSKKKLVEFLKKSPSLELAHIFDHKFINCTNPEDIQLVHLPKFEMLKDLVDYSDSGIFNNANNLRKFYCRIPQSDFLVKQNQLKELSLEFDLKESSTFSEDFTQQVKFRLEKLIVDDPQISIDDGNVEEKKKTLVKFINLHQNHLQDLQICARIESRYLKGFLINLKNLQLLKLSLHEDFEVDPELFSELKASNSGVKELELNLNDSINDKWTTQLLEKFIECFPNIVVLQVEFGKVNSEEHKLKITNPKLQSIEFFFVTQSKVLEHLELVELNNASFTFICLKSTPEQWHQFCVSNSKIQNLQIIEKNFDINIFKELTILKELRRLDIKSNHQNQSEAFHCAVMMRENCKNLIEMNLSEFSVKNTQTGFCYYENSSDEDDVET